MKTDRKTVWVRFISADGLEKLQEMPTPPSPRIIRSVWQPISASFEPIPLNLRSNIREYKYFGEESVDIIVYKEVVSQSG